MEALPTTVFAAFEETAARAGAADFLADPSQKFTLSYIAATPKQGKLGLPIFVGAMPFPVWSQVDWCDTAIYDGLALPAGAIVQGRAILEQLDETIFVNSSLADEVESFGNILMARSNDKNR